MPLKRFIKGSIYAITQISSSYLHSKKLFCLSTKLGGSFTSNYCEEDLFSAAGNMIFTETNLKKVICKGYSNSVDDNQFLIHF